MLHAAMLFLGQALGPEIPNLESALVGEGVDPARATIIVEEVKSGERWVVNEERSEVQFSPASTSKIVHTLIGLEEGVVTTDRVFKWDGRERWIDSWNEDQTIDTAFTRSALWVYQTFVPEIGHEKMKAWLANLNYGNTDIGGEDELDLYWVNDRLKISADEYIEFLGALSTKALPFSPSTYETAWPIMQADEGEGWKLYAKTGWFAMDGVEQDIGWYVGWAEQEDGDTYVFALNMDADWGNGDAPRRIAAARAVLEEIGAID